MVVVVVTLSEDIWDDIFLCLIFFFSRGCHILYSVYILTCLFFFDLPQNNPDIDAFESRLSFKTDFESFHCVTKMC